MAHGQDGQRGKIDPEVQPENKGISQVSLWVRPPNPLAFKTYCRFDMISIDRLQYEMACRRRGYPAPRDGRHNQVSTHDRCPRAA